MWIPITVVSMYLVSRGQCMSFYTNVCNGKHPCKPKSWVMLHGCLPRGTTYNFDCLITFLTDCELNTGNSDSRPPYCIRHCIFMIWQGAIFDHLQFYERQNKHAIGREIAVIKGLNEKFTLDEETDSEDSETFIKRTPTWRSNKLINEHYVRLREKKDNSKPCKARKIGQPSEWPRPVSAPKWGTTIELTPSSSPGPSSGSSSDPTDTLSGSNAASECASPEHTSLN